MRALPFCLHLRFMPETFAPFAKHYPATHRAIQNLEGLELLLQKLE